MIVVGVSADREHRFSKVPQDVVTLVEDHGVVGAHGDELAQGDLGENVLTSGLDLLALPTGTRLRLGERAVVRVTGLRNPCRQINTFRTGLLKVAVGRDEDGAVVRKAGVMGVVEQGGEVRPGDRISVELPDGLHRALEPV